MRTKSKILLTSIAAAIIVSLMAGYLLNVTVADQHGSIAGGDLQKGTTTADRRSVAIDGLRPRIPFAAFPLVNTLEEAQQRTTLLQIRTLPSSLLPSGYRLVGAVPMPVGPLVTDPGSGRTFRPQQVTLYFWNQPLTDPDMDILDFYSAGGIIIDESYALGVNSTDVYLVAMRSVPAGNLPPDLTIGWFEGYPGVWYDGYAQVFQFDKNMSYMVKGTSLTKDQALTIIDRLLKQ